MTPQLFLKTYSSEPQLRPLSDMGISTINRNGQPLNGQHAHSLMTKFYKGTNGGGEDFATYRYKPMRAHEPNPADMGAVTRHTNKMAANDPRIRCVSGTGLLGVFKGGHLRESVWGMASRTMRAGPQPDAEILAPPPGQTELEGACTKGVWVEVVSWEGVSKHPEVFKLLMRSENFDHAHGMSEDEMAFLRTVAMVSREVAPQVGENEFQAVCREALSCPGQPWDEADVEARYRLGKVNC